MRSRRRPGSPTTRSERVGCNTVEAQSTGRLLIADDVAVCDHARLVNVDVASYRVYRFVDPDIAGNFIDSDGDGYADRDEGTTADGIGSACNPSSAGAATVNHLAQGSFGSLIDTDGTRRITWRDTSDSGPTNEPGGVFWYRVASVGRSGKVSELGAPVRGLFVDMTKPNRLRTVSMGYCGPDTFLSAVPDSSLFAVDRSGEAAELRLYCMPHQEGLPVFGPLRAEDFVERIQRWVASYPYRDDTASYPGQRVVLIERDPICALALAANCDIEVEVVDPRGRVIGQYAIPDEDGCAFTVETEISCTQGFVAVQPGDVVERPLEVRVPLTEGQCAGISGTIGDKQYRLTTVCGPGTKIVELDPPDLGPAFSCLSVTLYGGGARTPSTDTALPCVTHQKPSAVPPPPRLGSLTFNPDATFGDVTWFAPEQPIGGVLVEFWEAKTGKRNSGFFGPGTVAGAAVEHNDKISLDGPLPQGKEEEWCLRAQAVSQATKEDLGGKLSAWTAPMCGLRMRTTGGVEYLPWPAMKVPEETGADMDVSYFRQDGVLAIQLATIPSGHPDMPKAFSSDDPQTAHAQCGYRPPSCNPDVSPCLCSARDNCDQNPTTYFLDCNYCQAVNKAAGSDTRMVVYRQSRTGDPDGNGPLAPEIGPFIQVSPFLDAPFCMVDIPRGEAVARVWDPFFAMLGFHPGGVNPDAQEFRLYFTDRVPHQIGLEYRYQFAYFDANGEPVSYRSSKWKEVPL